MLPICQTAYISAYTFAEFAPGRMPETLMNTDLTSSNPTADALYTGYILRRKN